MKLYPDSAREKLGFDVLYARLEALVRSPLGLKRLAQMRPSGDLAWVRGGLGGVSELQDAFNFDDPVPLDALADLTEVINRAAPEGARLEPAELLAVLEMLQTVRRLKGYFSSRKGKYTLLSETAAGLIPVPELENQIASLIDPDGNLRDDASPELRRLRQLMARRLVELRASVMRALREAVGSGYATEEQPTLRSGRMVIPVRAEARRKVRGFVHDTSATGQTVYIEPAESLDLNNEVREIESAERREVERILRLVTGAVKGHLAALRENQHVLAVFDLLQAKAALSNQIGAVVPILAKDGVIALRGARNPVLQLHFRQAAQADTGPREVVPLDLELGIRFHTLVITGPNAGGKSVAMKTVGLFALMLAYGMPIPADPASRFSLFNRLMVDIGDQQSIEEDLSTFSSHVAHLKHMLAHADAQTLILIDEAGTGTDPAEGGGLAQAVLERLTDLHARTIVTTHHGTLKVFAHEHEGVENGSMQFDRKTLGPTYVFQTGVPGSSYAFEIAQRIGLGPDILARARALIGTQKTAVEDLIATFETRNQELERQLAGLEAERRELHRAKERYEERLTRLRESTDAIRRQALAEAEKLVQGANARIEQAIREIRETEADREATLRARAGVEALKGDLTSQQQKLERKQRRRPRGHTSGKPSHRKEGSRLAVGDQVTLDEGEARGEILELADQEAVIIMGSMRLRVPCDRLTRVGGPRRQQVAVRHVVQTPGDLAALRARRSLDVRGLRVDEALSSVIRFLDEALAAGLDRVEIVHGKGTGALRMAIQEYLSTSPDVASFEEAPWDQGGPGVTMVTMR